MPTSIPPSINCAKRLAIHPISLFISRQFLGKATAFWCSRKSPTPPLKRASPRTTHLRIPFKAPFERRVPCRFQNQMFGLSSAQSASFCLDDDFFAFVNDRIFLRFVLLFLGLT